MSNCIEGCSLMHPINIKATAILREAGIIIMRTAILNNGIFAHPYPDSYRAASSTAIITTIFESFAIFNQQAIYHSHYNAIAGMVLRFWKEFRGSGKPCNKPGKNLCVEIPYGCHKKQFRLRRFRSHCNE